MVDGDGFNFWCTQKRKGRHMNKTAKIGRETKKPEDFWRLEGIQQIEQ